MMTSRISKPPSRQLMNRVIGSNTNSATKDAHGTQPSALQAWDGRIIEMPADATTNARPPALPAAPGHNENKIVLYGKNVS